MGRTRRASRRTSSASPSRASSSRMVVRCRTTTSRRKARCTWCCASGVTASERQELSTRRLLRKHFSGRDNTHDGSVVNTYRKVIRVWFNRAWNSGLLQLPPEFGRCVDSRSSWVDNDKKDGSHADLHLSLAVTRFRFKEV